MQFECYVVFPSSLTGVKGLMLMLLNKGCKHLENPLILTCPESPDGRLPPHRGGGTYVNALLNKGCEYLKTLLLFKGRGLG